MGLHTVFQTVREKCDIILTPGFLDVTLVQSSILFTQCLIRGCVQATVKLSSCLDGSLCGWGSGDSLEHTRGLSTATVSCSSVGSSRCSLRLSNIELPTALLFCFFSGSFRHPLIILHQDAIVLGNAHSPRVLHSVFQIKSVSSSEAGKLFVLWPGFTSGQSLCYCTKAEGGRSFFPECHLCSTNRFWYRRGVSPGFLSSSLSE